MATWNFVNPESLIEWQLWSEFFAALMNGDNAVLDGVYIRQDEDPTVEVDETEIEGGGILDIGYYNGELRTGNMHGHDGSLIAGTEAGPIGW